MNFEIETASLSDVKEMRRIERACWLRVYPNVSLGITKKRLSEFLDNTGRRNLMALTLSLGTPQGLFIVARSNQRIIGYAIAKKKVQSFLHHLYVTPEFFWCGIGSVLLKRILDWIGECVVETTVVKYNLKAIMFYEKFGFKENGQPPPECMARLSNGVIIPEIKMTIIPTPIKKIFS